MNYASLRDCPACSGTGWQPEPPVKQFEVRIPFVGFCSVLIDAESAEQAKVHALRLNSYEIMNGTADTGGIEEIHFKAAVRCGAGHWSLWSGLRKCWRKVRWGG